MTDHPPEPHTATGRDLAGAGPVPNRSPAGRIPPPPGPGTGGAAREQPSAAEEDEPSTKGRDGPLAAIEEGAGTRSDAARFGGVLVLLLATFIMLAAAPEGGWVTVVSTAMQAMTLLAALYAARSGRILMRIAVIVSAFSLIAALIDAIAGTGDQRAAFFLVDVMLIGTAPAAIVVGIIRRRRLDIQTVMGALCVYVLLGMFWAFVYQSIDALTSSAFFAQTAHPDTSDFLYFSFVTLTTTGYGDLTAADGLGRALAVLEALFGQLYLVTVVALLVGNLAPRRRP